MNWNFINSSVWLNIVAARASCCLALNAVAVAAAAEVAVAVSNSIPFSRRASSSYFCSCKSSIKFRCNRPNSRSFRTRVASISAIATSSFSNAAFFLVTSWKTPANSVSSSWRFRSRSCRFRWIATSKAWPSARSFALVSCSGGLSSFFSSSSVSPAAPVSPSCRTSRSWVNSERSFSSWSISCNSRSRTPSSFSLSRNSAWICDTRVSAFSWARCNASISSRCRSKATLLSSMNLKPSLSL